MKQESTNEAFAEIIESTSNYFMGQCWQWDKMPAFGSLVGIQNDDYFIFGLVHKVQTGPLETMRYPFAYQKTHAELLAEQPQIFEFLKTSFSCITLGYHQNNRNFYLLAPRPPLIHSFIMQSPLQLHKNFFAGHHYLHLLFSASSLVANLDELLLALLKQNIQQKLITDKSLNDFIQTYSFLIGNEYRRLKLFLQRIEHLL